MKFIRYILSHAIFLAFIIAIGFAYYYRSQLFPADVNAKIDDTVHRAKVWVTTAVKKESADTQETAASKPEQTADNTSAEIKPATTETAISTSDADAEKIPESDAVAVVNEPSSQVTEQAAASGTESDDVESKSGDKTSVDNVSLNPAQTSTDQQKPDSQVTDKSAVDAAEPDMIDQARLAFKAGDHAQSIAHYQQASKQNPDDPNAYGEMGNVYYLQGKWQQAGQAYYEAATRLLAQGHAGQVQYLYRVIQGLDQESAKKLSRQLSGK